MLTERLNQTTGSMLTRFLLRWWLTWKFRFLRYKFCQFHVENTYKKVPWICYKIHDLLQNHWKPGFETKGLVLKSYYRFGFAGIDTKELWKLGTEGVLGSCMSLGLFCSMLVARHSRCKKIPDVFSRINRVFDCSAFCPPLKRTPIYIRPKTFQNSYVYLLILCRKEGTFKSRRLGGFRYWRFVGFLYVLGAFLFHVSGAPFSMQENSRCIF